MGLFSGKKTTKTTYDPRLMDENWALLDDAQATKSNYRPYEGQLTADVTDELQDYWDAGSKFGSSSTSPWLTEAADGARAASTYNPNMITAPSITASSAGKAATVDPTGILSGLEAALGSTTSAAGVDRGAIRNIGVGAFNAEALAPFLNPATDQIVNTTMADIERQRQIQGANDGQKFKSGAWGGSRQGVADSINTDNFARLGARTAADTRGKAFDSAAANLMSWLGLDLDAQKSNQGADQFVAGQNAETSRFNAGEANQTSRFNASETNTNRRTGAGILSDLGQFNAGAINDRADNDADRSQRTSEANQRTELDALTSNQDAGIRGADLRLRGAGALGDLAETDFKQGMDRLGVLQDVGTSRQDYEQDALGRDYQLFTDEFDRQNELTQLISQILGDVPRETTTTAKTDPSLLEKIGKSIKVAGDVAKLIAGGG
jgi:hypothetical protein